MSGWTCPACGRTFGRRNQTHVCAPAMSVESYFASRPEGDREIFEAVAAHLRQLGPVEVEAVGVGILFKRGRTFVELRPRKRGMALSMLLSQRLDHPRIARRLGASGSRIANFVNLATAEEVDEQVRKWLTRAYAESGG